MVLIISAGSGSNEIQYATWADHRHSYSGTHQKTHGVVKGELEILDNLPSHLAQAMFARPGKYPAAIRHSTETTALIDDRGETQPRDRAGAEMDDCLTIAHLRLQFHSLGASA